MNYETRGVKIRLKPDSIEKAREWARVINERKDEAIEALCDESVIFDTGFLDQTGEGDFLIYLMKAENFAGAREAVQKSVHSIDEFHQTFKRETRAGGNQLELLIDLDRFPEIK